MKKALIFLIVSTLLLLSGCISPTDKEVGQAAISVTPIIFLLSLGFLYLFFRLWQRNYPQLTLSWIPNVLFFVSLLIIAGIFGNWFLTDDRGLNVLFLIIFGSSFLTVFFIVMRVWLVFHPPTVFTWVSVVIMSIYVLSTFPMIAGRTEGTSYSEYFAWLWIFPSTVFLSSPNYGWPGSLPALVFIILLVEVLIRIRKHGKSTE